MSDARLAWLLSRGTMSQLTDATPSDRHRLIASRFASLIDGVQRWDAPSPVADWDAAGVVEHLGWLPGFLQHIAGVELQVADADSPAGRFAAQSDAVQAIMDAPKASEVVETTMFGVMPLQHLIDQFYTADVFMHSWDLATRPARHLTWTRTSLEHLRGLKDGAGAARVRPVRDAARSPKTHPSRQADRPHRA